MRLQSILKIAVIMVTLLTCFMAYSQSPAPFISQLEGLNEGKEAKITMTDGSIGQDYIIQYRLKNIANWTESSIKIKKSTEATATTIAGLETNKNYCFRLMNRDSVTKTEISSNEACTINLKSTLLSASEVRLDWDKLNTTESPRIVLTYMEENGMNMNSIILSNLADTTFIFDQLDCSVKYKFNIELTFRRSNDFTKRTVIKSPQILVEPKSIKLLPALSSLGIVSTNGDNKINYIIYSSSFVSKYEIFKSVNGGELVKVSENSGNAFTDNNVAVGENMYCYAHKYVNACGNESELSARSCNIKLSSKTYGRLTWTPFIIHADEVLHEKGEPEYTVELIDASNRVMSAIGITKDTTIAINVESLSPYLSNSKFRVLSLIRSKINFQSQIIDFPIFSYSNSSPLYLILGNESSKSDLTVYPNPTQDKILIESSDTPVRFIELIDTKGQLIHKTEISGDTINLRDFEKGKYILRLYDANKKLLNTKNIVKW